MYQFAGSSIGKASLSSADLGILPISYAEPACWPICGWRGAIKRLIDIVVALLGLIVLSPLLLVTAVAIRLETPGNALFRQRRIGFANLGFDMWKRRSGHHIPHNSLTLLRCPVLRRWQNVGGSGGGQWPKTAGI
jgi:lipopolysaccharide/colanic/teichoic acid biosynthesis glycosyltransferase